MLPAPPEGLRHWRLVDAPALEAAWADPEVRLWTPPPAHADAASWIDRCAERWTLGLSLDLVIDVAGGVAGEIGLRNFTEDPTRAELGVWVGAAHRRRGLARRAVVAATDWAHRTLGVEQLWARTARDHRAANALFDAAGWRLLGERSGQAIWSHTPPGDSRAWGTTGVPEERNSRVGGGC